MSRIMTEHVQVNTRFRPRRLRQNIAIRQLVEEIQVSSNDLVQPLFILPGNSDPTEVSSMPGIFRRNLQDTLKECEQLLKLGIKAIAPFPQIDSSFKTAEGLHAVEDGCFLYEALSTIKKEFPELIVFSDLALDPYTTHGHDGLLGEDGTVLNDETVNLLSQMALKVAETGVDFVAPSDMMDGRVGAIRDLLDQSNFINTGILSYCVKYNSAFYGPFRDAVGSKKKSGYVDKGTYQMNPANIRDILREVKLDESEGADILMVKPAGAYLDVIKEVSNCSDLPISAYQVSGEYAQLYAAHMNGWLDLESCVRESLLGIKRAGAQLILTYFAKSFASGKFG